MGAGQTAAKTATGGAIGVLKGYGLAIFGSSIAGGIAAGFLGAALFANPLGIAAVVGAGLVGGAMFGFSVLGPLLGAAGAWWGAVKGARKGSAQTVAEAQEAARQNARAQVQAQAQEMGMSPEAYSKMVTQKSFTAAEDQRRANNINNGQNVPR